MKDFVKTLDDLPRIVKFILVLIGDLYQCLSSMPINC